MSDALLICFSDVFDSLLLCYPDGDCQRWTTEEEGRLKADYPDKEKLMEALPTRTWASILRRAWELGVTETNPRLSRAQCMALELEDLLTHQDREVMVYYGITLDDVPRGKPASLLWSRKHDNHHQCLKATRSA